MPNPRTRRDGGGGGPCFTCSANGGPYPPEAKLGALICLRPADSGKEVSRMPEFGCCAWRAVTSPPPPARS